MVTLNDTQYKELHRDERLGSTDSERMRNAWMIYNAEHNDRKQKKK